MGWIRKGWLAVLMLTASWGIGDTNAVTGTNILVGQKIVFKGLINSRRASTNQTAHSISLDEVYYKPSPGSTEYAVISALNWLAS